MSFKSRNTHPGNTDGIVIVGAGLAGLFTALKLAPLPVTVVTRAPLGSGAASGWAQGGIAAAVGLGDTPAAHAVDTLAAGGGLVDATVARFVAEEAPDRIRDLASLGVPFDRDANGAFVLSREAAHRAARVVRISGDTAGAGIMSAVIAAVRRTPSIRVIEGYILEDLVMREGHVAGVRIGPAHTRGSGRYEILAAGAVVLATGGVGALYAVTTNPPEASGIAIAVAARAGAAIADAEFVQFHPTALDVGIDPAPLVTEALRGAGATLVNRHGERFLTGLHRDAELAPRDVVARAVHGEILAGRGAFLDARRAVGARFPEEFPTVTAHCQAAGIDPARDLIPVAPAQHYHMGGVATDAHGRTSVAGLWACGECAATGLHGANRLASNSLLEAVVFGARLAADIAEVPPHASEHVRRTAGREPARPVKNRTAAIARLRETMSTHAGVVRDGDGLRAALAALRSLAAETDGDPAISDRLLAAQFILTAALRRTENRGAHVRSDASDVAHRSRTEAISKDGEPLRLRSQQGRSFLTLADLDEAAPLFAPMRRRQSGLPGPRGKQHALVGDRQ